MRDRTRRLLGRTVLVLVTGYMLAGCSGCQQTATTSGTGGGALPPPAPSQSGQAPKPSQPTVYTFPSAGAYTTRQTLPTVTGASRNVQQPQNDDAKEVEQYLQFAARVEEHRQMLLSDLKRMQQIVDRMDTDEIPAVSGFRQMRGDLNRQDANWRSTLRYFDSVKPPSDPCIWSRIPNVSRDSRQLHGRICHTVQWY